MGVLHWKRAIIGKTFTIDRKARRVSVQQKNFVNKLAEVWGVSNKAPTPSTEGLFDSDPGSPLLKNQLEFMRLIQHVKYVWC